MRRRALAVLLFLAATVLALPGCGMFSPDITSGTVTDKWYEESYVWYQSQCASYTSSGMCSVYMQIPMTEPEHYVIRIEDCDLRKAGDDECPNETFNIGGAEWDDLRVGDHWETTS